MIFYLYSSVGSELNMCEYSVHENCKIKLKSEDVAQLIIHKPAEITSSLERLEELYNLSKIHFSPSPNFSK